MKAHGNPFNHELNWRKNISSQEIKHNYAKLKNFVSRKLQSVVFVFSFRSFNELTKFFDLPLHRIKFPFKYTEKLMIIFGVTSNSFPKNRFVFITIMNFSFFFSFLLKNKIQKIVSFLWKTFVSIISQMDVLCFVYIGNS